MLVVERWEAWSGSKGAGGGEVVRLNRTCGRPAAPLLVVEPEGRGGGVAEVDAVFGSACLFVVGGRHYIQRSACSPPTPLILQEIGGRALIEPLYDGGDEGFGASWFSGRFPGLA